MQIGLKNLHYAKITKDDDTGVTYEAPKKIANTISAKISPKSASEKVYADDTLSETVSTVSEISVEIEIKELSLTEIADLLGHQIVSGVMVENKNDVPPDIALGFMSKKSNNKGNRFVWLLKGHFELFDSEYATEEDKPKLQKPKIKAVFTPRAYDGNWRFKVDDDQADLPAGLIAGWFTAVVDPNA